VPGLHHQATYKDRQRTQEVGESITDTRGKCECPPQGRNNPACKFGHQWHACDPQERRSKPASGYPESLLPWRPLDLDRSWASWIQDGWSGASWLLDLHCVLKRDIVVVLGMRLRPIGNENCQVSGPHVTRPCSRKCTYMRPFVHR
jgi:hypothetical protein